MAPQDEKLCFDLEFRYFLAAKDIPAYVACLWKYFSLDKHRKGLESWVVSVPAATNASNAKDSDCIKLLRFSISFTHKRATYADINEARVIFNKAFVTVARHVCCMSRAPSRERGLLEYEKLLRYYVNVRNDDSSWSWGNWGLSSYYYTATNPDDDSAISAIERFKEKYEESVPSSTLAPRGRTSSVASKLLDQTYGSEKDLRRLAPSLHTRRDVAAFNTRLRSVVEDHAKILACVTEVHSDAQLAADSAAEVTKFSNPKEKEAILNRSLWEKFASIFDRDHHNKYTEATAKLNDRAISLQQDAKAINSLMAQVNAQIVQHTVSSRLVTLYANTKIEHSELLSIWERTDADKKLLQSLFGSDIEQMKTPAGRDSRLCDEMYNFEGGQRALHSGERKLIKGLKKMESKLDRFNKDAIKARNKFAAGQLRVQRAKVSQKLEEFENDTDSAYSYDEKM